MLTKKVGTVTTYSYDRQRERLQNMTLMGSGSTLMQNKYRYDAVDSHDHHTYDANGNPILVTNPYKNDFTPIEETLWDDDRRGEIIYY